MGHDKKHGLYHTNSALQSSILPSITLLHPYMYNTKEAYLLHITLLQCSKNLKFSVSAMFTLLPLPNLDYYLQMKSQKYVYACDSTEI